MVIGFKGKNKRGSDVFSNDPYHNSWGGGGVRLNHIFMIMSSSGNYSSAIIDDAAQMPTAMLIQTLISFCA